MRPMAYDRERAVALLPLLRVISREIQERHAEIVRLEGLERSLEGVEARADELLGVRAELATNRFELRRTHAELGSLGCAASEDGPLTIHIPGHGGGLERGFAWRPGEPYLLLVADPAA